MSVADLTAGEKAGLKAKLYDVQKKLKIMDIEQEMKREAGITFNPKFEAKYNLHDREDNFSDTVKRGEMIRRKRLDTVKATLTREEDESCTFSPQITRKARAAKVEGSVGDRLYRQAIETQNKVLRESMRHRSVDPNTGEELFKPYQPGLRRSGHAMSYASPQSYRQSDTESVVSETSVFSKQLSDALYREADARQVRNQRRKENAREQDWAQQNAPKINKASIRLLMERNSRAVRAVFELVKVETASSAMVSYDKIKDHMETLVHAKKVTPGEMYATCDRIWALLDCDGTGDVDAFKFYTVCEAVMERGTPGGEWARPGSRPPNVEDLYRQVRMNIPQEFTTTDRENGADAYASVLLDCVGAARMADIKVLRSFLNDLIHMNNLGKSQQPKFVREWSSRDKVANGSVTGSQHKTMAKAAAKQKGEQKIFSPRINKNSRRLAASNLRREEQLARKLAAELGESEVDLDNDALKRSIVDSRRLDDEQGGKPPPPGRLSYEMERRIHLQSEIKAKKIAVAQKAQHDAALIGCTFSPDLSKTRASDARIHVRKLIGDVFDALLALQDAKRAIECRPSVTAKETDEHRYDPGHIEYHSTAAVKSDLFCTKPSSSPDKPSDFNWAISGLLDREASEVEEALGVCDTGSTGEYTKLDRSPEAVEEVRQELGTLAAATRIVCRNAHGKPLRRTAFVALMGPVLGVARDAKMDEKVKFELPVAPENTESVEAVAMQVIPQITSQSLVLLVGGIRRVRVATGSVGLPVYERLYAKAMAPNRPAATSLEVPQRVLEDIAECTFSPTLPPRNDHIKATLEPGKGEKGAIEDIKGVKEHFERIKARKKEEEQQEDIFSFNEDRYQKAMEEYRREPVKLFKWATDARIEAKARDEASKEEPVLVIEVKLSKTLNAKIKVRNGDTSEGLAKAFCLLYGLNEESKEALMLMISENMRLNGVVEGDLSPAEVDINEQVTSRIITSGKSERIPSAALHTLTPEALKMLAMSAEAEKGFHLAKLEEVSEGDEVGDIQDVSSKSTVGNVKEDAASGRDSFSSVPQVAVQEEKTDTEEAATHTHADYSDKLFIPDSDTLRSSMMSTGDPFHSRVGSMVGNGEDGDSLALSEYAEDDEDPDTYIDGLDGQEPGEDDGIQGYEYDVPQHIHDQAVAITSRKTTPLGPASSAATKEEPVQSSHSTAEAEFVPMRSNTTMSLFGCIEEEEEEGSAGGDNDVITNHKPMF